ncbi:methyltransferase type 11 [Oscillochloris trichoides DG-6]|uniref:Methyltransferase type 11 n=1 Tax=Oscillochloris trichoides DG-6 TaxID=765420 RepID=E1IBC1_9CHLR|nr:methyltransferase domain-containing protein [Oscillochloris trichoides]EFO81478.1 methyltransferase type 11 [Oscillochloris trichoides DG-6]
MSDDDGSLWAQSSHGDGCAFARLVNWGFERLYREFAWGYDWVAAAVSSGLWQRWGLAVLPFLHGRVLELGFGPGHLQLAMAQAGMAAWGVDASPQMVNLARQRLHHAGYPAYLSHAYTQHLPFAAATFDTVLATFPSAYILDPRSHHEIRRVLAPHGRVVVLPQAELDPGRYADLVTLVYRLLGATVARNPQPDPQPFWVADLPLYPHWVTVGPSRVLIFVS